MFGPPRVVQGPLGPLGGAVVALDTRKCWGRLSHDVEGRKGPFEALHRVLMTCFNHSLFTLLATAAKTLNGFLSTLAAMLNDIISGRVRMSTISNQLDDASRLFSLMTS